MCGVRNLERFVGWQKSSDIAKIVEAVNHLSFAHQTQPTGHAHSFGHRRQWQRYQVQRGMHTTTTHCIRMPLQRQQLVGRRISDSRTCHTHSRRRHFSVLSDTAAILFKEILLLTYKLFVSKYGTCANQAVFSISMLCDWVGNRR